MSCLSRNARIIIAVAAIHLLLTAILSAVVGWGRLFEWHSPHWVRALWAVLFSLPLTLPLQYALEVAPVSVLPLMPLNSLAWSWLVATPVLAFRHFAQTRQRQDGFRASAFLGVSVLVMAGIGTCYIPSNIRSQQEELESVVQRREDPLAVPAVSTDGIPQKP